MFFWLIKIKNSLQIPVKIYSRQRKARVSDVMNDPAKEDGSGQHILMSNLLIIHLRFDKILYFYFTL